MKKKYNYSVLIVLCLASALVPFMTSAINLALPLINADLALNVRLAGWIPACYILATAVCQIPCARLADMMGRRKIFILGVAIFAFFSILCGFATSGLWLIIWRIMTGVGSAMMFGTSTAILTSSVSEEKRGWALGLITAVVYISLAAGPLLGGVLATHFGWHSIFFAAAIVGVVVVIGAAMFIKEEWKETDKKSFDYLGASLYAVGLFGVIYGFSLLPKWIGAAIMIVGMLTLIIFGYHQKRINNPVFNIDLLLKNKVFRLSNVSALINYASTFAISFMLSLYLQYARGLTPRDAGLILICQSVVQSFVTFQSGKLSDRVSPTLLATSGMAMTALGLILLCFISAETSYSYLIGVLMLLGLGFGVFSAPNTNVIMSSVEAKDYSMASATMGTMRLTGQAMSMGIAMMAISLTMGNAVLSSALSKELLSSMKITFVICAIFCIIGVYTSSVRTTFKKV